MTNSALQGLVESAAADYLTALAEPDSLGRGGLAAPLSARLGRGDRHTRPVPRTTGSHAALPRVPGMAGLRPRCRHDLHARAATRRPARRLTCPTVTLGSDAWYHPPRGADRRDGAGRAARRIHRRRRRRAHRRAQCSQPPSAEAAAPARSTAAARRTTAGRRGGRQLERHRARPQRRTATSSADTTTRRRPTPETRGDTQRSAGRRRRSARRGPAHRRSVAPRRNLHRPSTSRSCTSGKSPSWPTPTTSDTS